MSKGITINVYQQDWMAGFAAFLDDGQLDKDATAHIALNIGANLLTVLRGGVSPEDLPYKIAEDLMHEIIHVLEAWCKVEFNEERVEALIEKYNKSMGR